MSAEFPADLPTFTNASLTENLGDMCGGLGHKDAINQLQDEALALATKVGKDSSAVTTSHDYKLSGVTGTDKAVSKTGTETLTGKTITSPTITNPTTTGTDTGTETLTNKTLSTGSTVDANVTVTEVLKKVYPVGSIYMNYLSTAPATLLGFGTWVAIAEAEAIVGYKSGDTPFGTVGSIGAAGAKTHTNPLSSAGGVPFRIDTTATRVTKSGPVCNIINSNVEASMTWGGGDGTNIDTSVGLIGSTDAGNSIQPSFVVYMWRRTA